GCAAGRRRGVLPPRRRGQEHLGAVRRVNGRRSHTTKLRVRYAETDQMGVVYHTHYLVWCEIGRTDFIRQLGVSYAELERQGLFLAVAEANIRYAGSARYDDPIRVETWLDAVQSRMIRSEEHTSELQSR